MPSQHFYQPHVSYTTRRWLWGTALFLSLCAPQLSWALPHSSKRNSPTTATILTRLKKETHTARRRRKRRKRRRYKAGRRRLRLPWRYRRRWGYHCPKFGFKRKDCYKVWRSRDPQKIHAMALRLLAWWQQKLDKMPPRAVKRLQTRRKRNKKFRTFYWWWDRYKRRDLQHRMLDALDRLVQPQLRRYPAALYAELLAKTAAFLKHPHLSLERETTLLSRLTRWMVRRPHAATIDKLTRGFRAEMLAQKHCRWWQVVFMAQFRPKVLTQLTPKLDPKWCEEREHYLRVRYLTPAQINQKLYTWAKQYPRVAKVHRIGTSTEGRPILALQLGRRTKRTRRHAVLLVGSQHGDEHVGAQLLVHFGQKWLIQYKKRKRQVRRWFNTRQIWMVPTANPDGLHFDLLGGIFKYWRYNRAVQPDGQIGVDLNRNFSFQWRKWKYWGRLNLPGTRPFSEPETQAIRRLVRRLPGLHGILDIHQYGRVFLHPYAYTRNNMKAPYQALFTKIGAYLTAYNRYRVRPARFLYPHRGTLGDWGFGQRQLLSFVLELGSKLYLHPKHMQGVFRDNDKLLQRFITLDKAPFPIAQHFKNHNRSAKPLAKPAN